MTALFLIALLGAAPANSAAPADDAARLRNLFSEGQQLFAERRFADAASRFERLYALKPHPSVLFNLARCYEKLQETPRALRAYRDYLHQSPDAADRGVVLESISALEARLRKRGVSQLMVFTDPPGARVGVDGKDLGEAPASAELVPGQHSVAVSAEGFVPRSTTVSVALDRSPLLELKLDRVPPEPPAAPRVAAPRGPEAPPEALPDPQIAVEAMESEEGSGHGSVAPWICAGGAVASAAVGGAFHWKATQTAAEYRASTDFVGRRTLGAQADRQALLGNVGFAVAGAAAVTAVVLFLVSR